MERILDFESKFDCELFDRIVEAAFDVNNSEQSKAEKILSKFKESPSSWTKVDAILTDSRLIQSKFLSLKILEDNIKLKWALLDENTKTGIREYVFNYIVRNATSSKGNAVLNKCNMILVDIIECDWPKKIPDFFRNLIETSKSTSMTVSANTLSILQLFNERIFQSSKGMTTVRRRILTNGLKEEYPVIFSFIQQIMEYSETREIEPILLENCLGCLSSFCSTMEPGYIYVTRIIEILLSHINTPNTTQILKTLTVIICLFEKTGDSGYLEDRSVLIPRNVEKEEVYRKIAMIHSKLSEFLKSYLKKYRDDSTTLAKSYNTLGQNEKQFIESLALALSAIYRNFMAQIPIHDLRESFMLFTEICEIKDLEFFKTLFYTYRVVVYEFYSEYPLRPAPYTALRRNNFKMFLTRIIKMLVYAMPKPKEVFIIINELGEVVKDRRVVTEDAEFYRNMQEIFFHLSHSIEEEICDYFIGNFHAVTRIIDGFDAERLNKLTWAFGALANAFDEDRETDNFTTVEKYLLNYCALVSTHRQKSIVASDVLFVIRQYTRFFKRDPSFFQVVIFKLIEFMREENVGIKEMTTDTFFTLCKKTPEELFRRIDGRNVLIEIVVEKLRGISMYLEFYMMREIIEGLFNAMKVKKIENKEYVMSILNCMTVVDFFNYQLTGFSSNKELKQTCHLFETYRLLFVELPSMATALVPYKEILDFYVSMSGCTVGNHELNKIAMDSVLKLLIEISGNLMDNNFLNRVVDVVVMGYQGNKNLHILQLCQNLLLHSEQSMYVQRSMVVITNVLMPTLPEISNGDNNPELAIAFLELLLSMLDNESFFSVNFPLIFNGDNGSSVFASILNLMGCMKDISDVALNLMQTIFRHSYKTSQVAFFRYHTINVIENILGVLFDKDTRQNKELQIELFFEILQTVLNIEPISPNHDSNQSMIMQHLNNLFSVGFDNVTQSSMRLFYEGLFGIRKLRPFTDHMEDFIVKVNKYGNDDDINEEYQLLQERISN